MNFNPSGPPFFRDQIDGLVEKTRGNCFLVEAEASRLWPMVSEHCLKNFFKRIRRRRGEQPPRIPVLSTKDKDQPPKKYPIFVF